MKVLSDTPLKFAASVIMGQSPPSESYGSVDNELPFLQGNGEFGSLAPSARHGCDAASKRCRAGDLLFSVRAPVGVANVADQIYGIGRGLCGIRAGDRLSDRFLWYLAPLIASQLHLVATGSTYDAVSVDDVKNVRVPVPPLEEQRRIAEFLDAEIARLDRLITRKLEMLRLLIEKRRAITRAAVAGELPLSKHDRVGTGPTWLTAIPSHWRVAKLSLVAKLGTGHTPDRSEAIYWSADRSIPWLTTSDIHQFRDDRLEVINDTRESISEVGLENSSAVLHPAGTVALSRTASVGFSVIMGRGMATSQDFVTWTCSDHLEPEFLLLCLRTMRTDLVGRLATGSTHKTIYMAMVQGLRVPLPPVSEQREAVETAKAKLCEVDELASLVESQLPLLEERRRALITAAVTGQLDPSSHNTAAATG